MANIVQLTGGSFQDTEGNLLANGYLLLTLSKDCTNGSTAICSNYTITIPLNVSGNVVTSTTYSVWANDVLSPPGSMYFVTAYTNSGQPVWGQTAQTVPSSSSTFDIGGWIPQ